MMTTFTSKQILAGSSLLVAGSLIATRNFWWTPRKVLETPSTTKQGNRIFLPIRFENELDDLLLIKRPLLLNFTVRGDPYCNKLTGALQRIIAYETDKKINMVDIETDEIGTKGLISRFGVRNVPSIVAVNKQLPEGWYIDERLKSNPDGDVDWEKLKKFIEDHAEEE